jgi:hypothetical protein
MVFDERGDDAMRIAAPNIGAAADRTWSTHACK